MEKIEYQKMFELEDSHFWFVGKRLFIKSILDKYFLKKKINILDIGCGTGGLTKFLNQYGKVIGLEKDPLAIKLAKNRNLNIVKGNAQKLPFLNRSFDLITIFDVLYHKNIKDENRVIKEARRVLKPGGFLMITDSAFNFLKSNHDLALHGNKRFTIKYFEQLLKKDKFRIIKASYIFFFLFPFLLLKRRILDLLILQKQSDIQEVPFFINNLLIKILSFEAQLIKKINLPFGSSLILLAKKD